MKYRAVFAACSMAFAVLLAQSAIAQSSPKAKQGNARMPGPYIIPIDYEALYRSKTPPAYKPFEVYGWFLVGVAVQQTPMVFNPRMPVPDHITQTKNVIFKEVSGSKLGVDIYRPKNDTTPNPLILVIHGGYWKSGDKSVHVQQGIEFAELGYTVAAMNYRLSADHKFPANIVDIYDCLKYLTEHASEFNIDPERIVTYGGSAGGHLSAFIGLAANTKGRSYNSGINPDAIKGVISLYGMHDLTLQIQKGTPLHASVYWQDFRIGIGLLPRCFADLPRRQHRSPRAADPWIAGWLGFGQELRRAVANAEDSGRPLHLRPGRGLAPRDGFLFADWRANPLACISVSEEIHAVRCDQET